MLRVKIDLVLYQDHVGVIFVNDTDNEMHFWELWNSWGWFTVAFQVKATDERVTSSILHLWNAEFTKNGPTTFVVSSGEKREFTINLNHFEWMRDHRVERLKDKALQIRVVYVAEPMSDRDLQEFVALIDSRTYPAFVSDEAIQRNKRETVERFTGVFAGHAESNWVTVEPPHDWLFGDRAASFGIETSEQLAQYPSGEVLRRVFGNIDYLAWYIELNAKRIVEPAEAQFHKSGVPGAGMTTGHYATNMLEYALLIQRVIAEVKRYLEPK
jgi:hypothetical protein